MLKIQRSLGLLVYMTLTNKNYIVAGGSSGIGHQLASLLLDQGAQVWILSRHAPDDLIGRGAQHIMIDFGQAVPSDIPGLPDLVDGVAYCPGNINLKPFGRISQQDFANDYQLNVLGAVGLLQVTHKLLRKSESASVVLFSTVAAKLGMGFHASIAASKGAVEGLGKSLASEWAPQKIRVNIIAPSLTDTPLASALLSTDDKREASNKRHPIGRFGTADDIAQAALWLLGPHSTWVTGQVIGVDGGMGSLK